MANLTKLFIELGYTSWQEQFAQIKLLAYKGAFKEDLNIPEGKILTDEQAKKALRERVFKTSKDSLNWYINFTQANYIRKTAPTEGLHKANLERWHLDNAKETETKLVELFDALGYIKSETRQNNKQELSIIHVLILGALEPDVRDIVFNADLPENFSGILYYCSSQRGLFKHEPCVAPILANWLGVPEKEKDIQEILNHYPKNWPVKYSTLEIETAEIRELIKNKLGLSEWDTSKGTFNIKSNVSKVWPTEIDMIKYVVELAKKKEPTKFGNIKLKLCSPPDRTDGKLINTSDTLQHWKKIYGDLLLASETGNQKITLQALSTQPRVRYQKVTVEKDLGDFFDVKVTGPGLKEVKPDMIFDSMARADFTLKPKIETQFSKLEADELEEDKQYNMTRVQV